MLIIVGGTGQVGSAAARTLLERKERVTIVTRHAEHGAALAEMGATIVEADIRDTTALRDIFRDGKRAFLLNPPADPATDTDKQERQNVTALVEALAGSGLEKIVAASTYGARPGQRCGDLTVLHEFEEKLRAQPIPVAINRGAYYMSNWTGMIDIVRATGTLPSFFPGDMMLPMVAPDDLGKAAANRLVSSIEDVGIWHVEGPERRTPNDVADAFGTALKTDVRVETIPRDQWMKTFIEFGFSDAAAASYASMTTAVVDGETSSPKGKIEHGKIALEDYIREAVSG